MTSKPAPAITQQVTKTELPEWVEQAGQENYELAKTVADKPFEQYQGPRVAAESPLTQQGYDYVKSSIGALDPYFNEASDALARSTGFQNQAGDLLTKASQQYDATQPLYGQSQDAIKKAQGLLDQTQPIYDQARGAIDYSQGMLDAANPLYAASAGAISDAGGSFNQAGDIYRSTAGPLNIQQFLNPYTAEVERNAIGNAERSLQGGLLSIADKQKQARAWGGSRGAIESGVAQAEGSRGIGDLSAQLRKAGIDFATGTALQDRSGRQAAAAGLTGVGQGQLGQASGYLNTAGGIRDSASGYQNAATGYLNTAGGLRDSATGQLGASAGYLNTASGMRDAAAGQVGAGTGMLGAAGQAGNTATGYLNTAAGKSSSIADEISRLFGAGGQQQAQGQRLIDADMQKFQERQQSPVEALNVRLAALGMTPYGKTETGNKTSTSERLPTDWATVGLGAFKAALPFMSDRRLKTDIKKVGDDPLAGIPIYSYRYRGDPKTYPKVVGPMAQDIEKKFPDAIQHVGKYKAIDMEKLADILK